MDMKLDRKLCGRCAIVLMIVLAMIVLLLPAASAQEEPESETEQVVVVGEAFEAEAAHDALRELRKIYEQAVNENKVELLEPYIDEDFTGVMVTGDLVSSYAELQDYWQGIQDQLKGGTYVTALEPDLSWLHNNDIAVAKGTTTDLVTSSQGTEFHFTSSWTAVLVNRDGAWKLRRIQGTMDPIGNEFVQKFRQQAMIWSAVIAGLAGLIVGFLIGRRKGKA